MNAHQCLGLSLSITFSKACVNISATRGVNIFVLRDDLAGEKP